MNNLLEIKKVLTVILCSILFSCSETKSETKTETKYFSDLGEIPFDERLDDINFKVCHEDITFPFNYGGVGLIYEGEKKELVKTFMDNLDRADKVSHLGRMKVSIANQLLKIDSFKV